MNIFLFGKKAVFGVILGSIIASVTLAPMAINADTIQSFDPNKLIKNGHLTVCKIDKDAFEAVKKIKMILTAYSSNPYETDETPLITASGHMVADGIIANNLLPFGTKIRIPSVFGDKIFVIEDRMNERKGKYQADIWMPNDQLAKDFGAKLAYVEVIEN